MPIQAPATGIELTHSGTGQRHLLRFLGGVFCQYREEQPGKYTTDNDPEGSPHPWPAPTKGSFPNTPTPASTITGYATILAMPNAILSL